MKTLPIIIAFAAISACAHFDEGDADEMRASLAALDGQPLSVAVARLGLPSSQVTVGNLTVHEWMVDNVIQPGAPAVPLKCSIRLSVDSQNVIQDWDWGGNGYACNIYLARLKGV